MIEQVAFCMYPVQDLQRARQFYEEVLGLSPGLMTDVWVEYALPGIGSLALFATKGIRPSHRAGGSVALQVQDLDQCSAALKEKGVKFLTEEPIQSEVNRMQPIMDSEGNGLMLIEMLTSETENTEQEALADEANEDNSAEESAAEESAVTESPAEEDSAEISLDEALTEPSLEEAETEAKLEDASEDAQEEEPESF